MTCTPPLEVDGRSAGALDYLAGTIIALAIFALPISLVLTVIHHSLEAGLIAGLSCLLTAAALVRFLATRNDGMTRGNVLRRLAAAALTSWVTAALALYVSLVVIFSSSRCGGHLATTVGEVGAVAVYAAAGGWCLGRRSWLAHAVMPVSIVVGFTWGLLAWRYLPAIPGCYND